MKKFITLFIMMLFASFIYAQVPKAALVYENGPYLTSGNYSVLVTPHVNYGFGCGKTATASLRCADDFVISDISWHVDSVAFYVYQTSAPTSPTPFTAFTVRIWSGTPGSGTVVWGDTVTNILTNSYFTGNYRSSDLVATTRAIFKNVCTTPSLTLNNGTYWIDWQATGSASYTGPWQVPITITGQDVTGNAMQMINGVWNLVKDSSSATSVLQQGLPFTIYGSKTVGINELDNESSFNMYPNPVKNELTVEVSSMMKNVKVYDLIGQIVFTADVNTKNYKVNTSNLTNGAYFVEVETEKGFIRKKFVVSQ